MEADFKVSFGFYFEREPVTMPRVAKSILARACAYVDDDKDTFIAGGWQVDIFSTRVFFETAQHRNQHNNVSRPA